ncbi:unnamed protein product [Heligmosomoides polygyrus]|uniref:Secreted protein n=1 Tax=Heligmosomoides polygyrus TaxID=6339 RepID=A0A183FER6_HELPZ|nr:unnamed protein product [Heligmosomoides polygyrus]
MLLVSVMRRPSSKYVCLVSLIADASGPAEACTLGQKLAAEQNPRLGRHESENGGRASYGQQRRTPPEPQDVTAQVGDDGGDGLQAPTVAARSIVYCKIDCPAAVAATEPVQRPLACMWGLCGDGTGHFV